MTLSGPSPRPGKPLGSTQWPFALFAACCLAGAAAGQTTVARRYTETLLAPFPPEVRDSAMISPDLRRIAYVRQVGPEQRVVVNGQEQKGYQKISELVFSPDGNRLAYAAARGDKWVVVLDGQQQGPYELVGPPVFSPDSNHLAYVAMLPDRQRVIVLDGRPGMPCERIFEGMILFSPDSRRMAFGALQASGWFVVDGQQEWGPYEFLGSATGFRFSPDSTRLAFAALSGSRWFVVLDGKPQPAWDNLGPLAFSPDGKRVAYAAMQQGKWLVVADGKAQKAFDTIGEQTLRWSPDSRHLAYAAQTDQQWCVVVDGRPGQTFQRIGQMEFSPDGRVLAYIAGRDSRETVVRESVEGPGATPGFEPERASAETAPRWFDRIGDGTLVFSPAGRRLAFVARTRRASFVVVDGKRKPGYDLVGYLTFTPDGRYPVYAAVKAGKTFTVVEDREAAHQYEAIWLPRGQALRFVGPTRFCYLAVKQGNIYLVQEQLD